MEGKIQYKRGFLIFNQEDAGFGTEHEPAGYAKIEVREGAGKLFVSTQNLKQDNDKIRYRICLLKSMGSIFRTVTAGYLPLHKGKSDFSWEFDASNVASTGASIDEFNVIAVIVEYKDRDNNSIICPLAAYKDKRVDWRSAFREEQRLKSSGIPRKAEQKDEFKDHETLKRKESMQGIKEAVKIKEDFSQRENILSIYKNDIESKYSPPASQAVEEKPEPEISDNTYGIKSLIKNIEDQKAAIIGSEQSNSEKEDSRDTYSETGVTQPPQQPSTTIQNGFGCKYIRNDYSGFTQYDELYGRNGTGELSSNHSSYYNNCNYTGNGYCTVQPRNLNYHNCMNCQLHAQNNVPNKPQDNEKGVPAKETAKAEQKKSVNEQGDIEKLRDNLNKYFEISNPFGSRNSNYRWWKINSPVYLNNILHQCNIKTPLLFNPSVMMAHFKYRHLIMGIYVDRTRRREYVVCGVPGVYGLDEKPFGEMCRWVQLEGYKPKYGSFGYWLAYIDPKTGKLLKVS